MSKFHLRFRELRNSRKMSQQELADSLGISKSSVNMYERGEREPGLDTLEAIADYFNVDMDYLMGKTSELKAFETINGGKTKEPAEKSNISYVYPKNEVYSIPLFESVSAGFGAYADSEILGYIPIVLSNPHDLQDTIAIKVKGNSMYPLIIDGDCIIVRKQESVDSGTIGVVLLDGNEGLVKRIVYGDDWIELQSVNPEYAPKRFEGAEVQRLRVVGKVTKIDREL